MKIGNLNFDKSVFLAPMAGVTDISFRGLCKEMGCGLVYTEMVSAKALYYGSENTKSLLRIADEEKPVAAQIFGNDPKIMSEVVQSHFNNMNDICILDINMGCPAPKITKNGEGSALMLNPKLAGEIVSEIKKFLINLLLLSLEKVMMMIILMLLNLQRLWSILELMQLLFMEELKSKCMKEKQIGI